MNSEIKLLNYVVPKPNTDHLKRSIPYQAVTLWSSVDKTLARFKKSVKALLTIIDSVIQFFNI